MEWFQRDFDHPAYFDIYRDKEADALEEGPALATLLALPRGSLVLDLPCGWGRLRPALVDQGYQVMGGDLSFQNLRRHRQEAPGPLVRLDFRALPFRSESADGVFCAFTSWGYFDTWAENLRQLSEFARVLKPGGTLLLDLIGRLHLERVVTGLAGRWVDVPELGYRERVRWNPDGQRVWTDRIAGGESFRHDIWIPTQAQIGEALNSAGFDLDEAFGGLDGNPWRADSERWIFRAIRTDS